HGRHRNQAIPVQYHAGQVRDASPFRLALSCSESSCPGQRSRSLVFNHPRVGDLAKPLAALALAAALIIASVPAPAQTPEGGTVKAQHGDWQVVCKPPPPGAKNEVCALVQSV